MSGEFFATSDTFFGRPSIIDIAKRPFSSIEEMNESLLDNWNKVVKPNDTVYHLGNLAWNPVIAEDIIKLLNGKIYLISLSHRNDVGWLCPGFLREF